MTVKINIFLEFSWLALPCPSSPSVCFQPRELVEAYYRAPKTSIRESKVIFLGDGGVGKSFTIQRLLHGGDAGDYPTEVTPGIDISDYHVQQPDRDFHIHFWDFGGQEIMHAMHRCFLTTRTCYVVVVCNRMRDLTGQARYWLNNINSFAEGSPVILAINLWDDIPTWELDSTRLHREFPNLVQIIPYSAKKRKSGLLPAADGSHRRAGVASGQLQDGVPVHMGRHSGIPARPRPGKAELHRPRGVSSNLPGTWETNPKFALGSYRGSTTWAFASATIKIRRIKPN